MQNDIDIINSFDEIAKTNIKTNDWSPTNHYYKRLLKMCCSNQANILDIGCGEGDFVRLAAEKGYSCTGIDFASEMIKKAETYNADILDKCNFVCGNAYDVLEDMPVNSFDAVYSFAAMHHMEYAKIIPILSKCVKKGGFFAVVDLYKNTSSLLDCLIYIPGFIASKFKRPKRKRNKKSENDINIGLYKRNRKAWDEHWKIDLGLGFIVPFKEIKKRLKATGTKFKIKRLLYFRYMVIIYF